MVRLNRELARLHLHGNPIGDELCQAVSQNLHSVLYDLKLGKDRVADQGALWLAQCPKILMLKLAGSKVTGVGILALVDGIQTRAGLSFFRSLTVELDIGTPEYIATMKPQEHIDQDKDC